MTTNKINTINNATIEVAKKFLEEGYLLVGNAEKAYALPVPDNICEQALKLVHECDNMGIYKETRVCSVSSSYTVYFHTVIRGVILVVSEKFDFYKHQWVFADIKLIQIEEKEEKKGKKYQLIAPYIGDSISWYMDLWDNK